MPASGDIERAIAQKKAALDAMRPLPALALAQLRKHYDLDLTYTSNAIEGNTLTMRETAEVIEHGITVGGKRLRDHLEALDHYEAVQWVHTLADRAAPLDEAVMCELHRRIVARSQPEIVGVYAMLPRRILGSAAIFPNPAKVPELMHAFGAWLAASAPDLDSATEAHLRLVSIHPFSDGNGRAARLLMNLVLLRAGYPPVSVRLENRNSYLDAIEQAQTSGDGESYRHFMLQCVDDSLGDYLQALGAANSSPP